MDEDEDDDGAAAAALFEEPAGFRPPSPPATVLRLQRVRPTTPTATPTPTQQQQQQQERAHEQEQGKDRDAFELRLVGRHSLWAHCLWNAGVELSRYLDANPEIVHGKRVLEMGAAAAVPSLVAALNGASKVVITDYPDAALVDNITFNVDHNLPGRRSAGAVAVLGYQWGKPVEPLLEALGGPMPRAFDVIILADVVFNHNQHHQLLQACCACLRTDPVGEVYVPFTPHRPWLVERDRDFFRLAAAPPYDFEVDQPFQVKAKPMFPDDPGDEELRSTVFGYRLRRRPA